MVVVPLRVSFALLQHLLQRRLQLPLVSLLLLQYLLASSALVVVWPRSAQMLVAARLQPMLALLHQLHRVQLQALPRLQAVLLSRVVHPVLVDV